jgi:hypothetical protein
MSPGLNEEKLTTFFRLVFGEHKGYMALAFLSRNKAEFREEFYQYPVQLPSIVATIIRNSRAHNVYFCPHLFNTTARKKEHVSVVPSAWADLDACPPDKLLIKPTIVVQSSPGRYQAIWRFDDVVDPEDAEGISKKIAYYHQPSGADISGWDLTQLLRVPGSHNLKAEYLEGGIAPVVDVIELNTNRYRQSEFDVYPEIEIRDKPAVPMPSEDELDGYDSHALLKSRQDRLSVKVERLFAVTPTDDWSGALWELERLLFEAGFNAVEVFVICRDAACNKYLRDGRQESLLWKEVCRAETADIKITRKGPALSPLLTDAEREILRNLPITFIERYQKWAAELGDAAVQYHEAGAFVILSSLLSGPVRLPTSFGNIVLNLWFMILADTTLTRKSTAMDLAADLVEDIDPDVKLATDGSIEGLMQSLSGRAGRPSMFHRDEVTGLIESMTKKDYLAGMAEMFTKLYDGKSQKRVLRKEIISVRNPVVIFFAGGIKDRLTSILTPEQISSGFMPRFIFITAQSDPSKVKPIGPPTVRDTSGRERIEAELRDMFAHYRKTVISQKQSPNGTIINLEMDSTFDAELTPDAWNRYNELETTMVRDGIQQDMRDLLTPTFDRLAKSTLKAAVLIAASEQREETVRVELEHILRAIGYAEKWRKHAIEVIEGVGIGPEEHKIQRISSFVKSSPGASRSVIMQRFHLTAREASQIFDTLLARGSIMTPSGRNVRGARYYPVEQ